MAASVTVTLKTGLAVGDQKLTQACLREVTAGDIIEAQEEAEKLMLTPDGPALVPSPTLVAMGVLRRQIVSIGDVQGPISLSELKRLTPYDLNLLQAEADTLDQAMVTEAVGKGLTARGRAEGAGK